MKNKLIGFSCLLICTAIWGSAFVSQSIGMDYLSPFGFQAIRCGLAVIALLPVIAISDKFKYKQSSYWSRWADAKLWKAGLICGIPLFVACNLQQLGIADDTDPGKSAFLTAMYIVLVPVIRIFWGKKPTKWLAISILPAIAGLYFLTCMNISGFKTGDFLLLGCAGAFAVQILLVEKFAPKIDALRLNVIQALVCAVFSGVMMTTEQRPTTQDVLHCAIPLIHAGVFSMGIAYSLQIIGQKYMDSTTSSLIMSTETVFAVLFGWVIMNKTLTLWEGIGCVLMFAAVIISQLPDKSINSKVSS